jgi:hypothetical protein
MRNPGRFNEDDSLMEKGKAFLKRLLIGREDSELQNAASIHHPPAYDRRSECLNYAPAQWQEERAEA